MFMRGAENRMGFVAHRNLPFGSGVIVKLLEMVKEEIAFWRKGSGQGVVRHIWGGGSHQPMLIPAGTRGLPIGPGQTTQIRGTGP